MASRRYSRLRRHNRRFLSETLAVLAFVMAIALVVIALLSPKPPSPPQPSNYELSWQVPFNQPSFYPLKQTPPVNVYRSTGTWVGRLILPKPEQTETKTNEFPPSDWVWFEVYNAPNVAKNIIGKTVRLEWGHKALTQAEAKMVTTNVRFTRAAVDSTNQGKVTPTRLNGRYQVGPLQSLAGARANDDVVVSLSRVTVTANQEGGIVLQSEQEPVLVTGRYSALVEIVSPKDTDTKPQQCPGESPCPSELFLVRHYNPKSKQFDGPQETIRIPQQPANREGRFPSTPRQLEASLAGKAGWYIYGAKDANGVFTVEALKPRLPFMLKPDEVILGQQTGHFYISEQNWFNTEARKGTAQSVLVDPSATTPEEALAKWKEGDYGLVIHLLGGIGGQKGESTPPGTVTGHFSFGIAQVVRDSFTNEPQLDIRYEQVYAHNPNGIIAGSHAWANYMGNLQRGWLGTRPVSDVVVRLGGFLQDYNFEGYTLSPLRELLLQLQIMTARYRTGDGTGHAVVSPAVSCVQDSSQALYIAIERIKQQATSNPAIASWLANHPDDSQTLRFEKLVAFAKELETTLTPYGVVRPDWQHNAEVLAGVSPREDFVSSRSLVNALLSWRSMLPRRAHDEMARLLLKHGTALWFIRTNQVGGWDPEITPQAPTMILGQFPIVSTVLDRVTLAMGTPLGIRGWLIVLAVLLVYGAIALPLGFTYKFLKISIAPGNLSSHLLTILGLFFLPALAEEFIFRVVLLPHPLEGTPPLLGFLWAISSLLLFVGYHPMNARHFYRQAYPTFAQPIFLALVGLLGLACTVAYELTGSLLGVTVIHWIVVSVWLLVLDGQQKLQPKPTIRQPRRYG